MFEKGDCMKRKQIFLIAIAVLITLGVGQSCWAWTIGGVVVDREGEPVEGAQVILEGIDGCPHGQGDFYAETETDGDGAFSFEDLETGCYNLTASAENLGEVSRQFGNLRRNVEDIRLQLPGGGGGNQGWIVSGIVVDPEGEPVEGATVVLEGIDGCPHGQGDFRAETETDGNGAFIFENVPTGCYDISASAEGLGEVSLRLGLVREDIEDIQLQLPGEGGDEEGWSISGVVIGPEDERVEGAAVVLSGIRGCPHGQGDFRAETETDRHGAFIFENIPTGCFDISASAPDLGEVRRRLGNVDEDIEGLRLQLPGEGGNDEEWNVGGLVVDAGGQSVTGGRVILSGIEGCPHGQEDFRAETQSDEDGFFIFENVPTGCFDIHAMADGLGGTRQRLGTVRQDIIDLRLELPGRNELLGGVTTTIEPGVLEFNDVQSGTDQILSITIRNIGRTPLMIATQRILPDNSPFSIRSGGGGVQIEPSAEHETQIGFAPEDENVFEAVFQIVSPYLDEEPIEIPLIGTALTVILENNIPVKKFTIENIWPNPFNASVGVSYLLPTSAHVQIQVFDLAGQIITTLVEDKQTAGSNGVIWNATSAPPGTYLVRMKSEDYSVVRKIVLIK